MEKKIYLVITISFFILFFLILINFLIAKKSNKNNNQSPTPTISNQNIFFNNKTTPQAKKSPTPTANPVFTPKLLSKIIIKPEESVKITNLIKKLPLDTPDFSASYFPLSNKIVFIPKNEKGLEKINQFLIENQLDDFIKKYPSLTNIINQEEFNSFQNEEENLLQKKDNQMKNQQSRQTNYPTANSQSESIATPSSNLENNSYSLLIDILKIILNFNQPNQTTLSPTIISPTLPSSLPTIFNPQINPSQNSQNYTSLQNLFNEVGEKVGVPPKILEAVLTIEMPSTFNLTSEEINRYSLPSAVIPGCGPNVCSATGPMQMTIGIDNSGSSSCSSCCNATRCLNQCPNQWNVYGSAVNIFTSSTHQPNPCNLRDNIYAAAYKLKTDSGASDPLDWTQEQVYRASERYYGSCSDKYRYARLGNRTYCEYVWWYYNNK